MVEEMSSLTVPAGHMLSSALAIVAVIRTSAPPAGLVGSAAEVVLIAPISCVMPAPFVKAAFPRQSQSPAVSETDVMFAGVLLVSAMALPRTIFDETYSPTLPALALSAAVVPLMPLVVDGVMRPVAPSVVKLPAAGVVPPIAGGVAAFAVANVPNAVPLVLVQMVASEPDVVQLPERSPLVIEVAAGELGEVARGRRARRGHR